MSHQEFGFYFEKSGRAAAQGAIDPAEEYFEGSRAEVSVVRETGQNSLDAVDGTGPVRMEFELAEMSVNDLPGIEDLRSHLEGVVDATAGSQGHDRMVEALDVAKNGTISVLRISDYGTKGLCGSESVDSQDSPLSALTRGSGISANDGRGGSFGIGSAVGPMASRMSTVFYTSLPADDDELVFAGYSRLATHKDADGEWRGGDGFYTDLDYDDFKYRRGASLSFGPFAPRTEPGTDLYIVAYKKADDDSALDHIREAFVDHFMMAIHEGRLTVKGITGFGGWELTSETLEQHASGREESEAFYRAINDPEPIEHQSKRLGRVRLYVNVDETLTKTLNTVTMRAPLMRIETFKHTSIPAKYAAVLVCDSDQGNILLRALEPPQHDEWDGGRASGGLSLIKELKDFVRQGLRSRVKETLGDVIEIKGLAKYLPSEASLPKSGTPGLPADGTEGGEESATVHGDPDSQPSVAATQRRAVKVKVQRPAVDGSGHDTKKGKDAGGAGTRKKSGGDLGGGGEPGDGTARISSGDVRFRSWSAGATIDGHSVMTVALTSNETIRGDLELVPLGLGGSPEADYVLPVSAAQLITSAGRIDLAWEGNLFKSVALEAGETGRLEITLPHGHRYRLDVK